MYECCDCGEQFALPEWKRVERGPANADNNNASDDDYREVCPVCKSTNFVTL
jgi:hypothetical protein